MTLRRTTLADQVAERLLEHIEEAGLGPGDELAAEAEIARSFGVNRLVVREAIRTLAAREILESSQGRPARVTVPSGRVLGQILEFRLRQHSLDLADLLAARRLIECDLVRRAAEQVAAGRVDTAQVAQTLADMRLATEDRDTFVALDVRFHAQLAEMSGARLLGLLLDSMEEVLLRARQATYDARRDKGLGHDATVAAHLAVLEAVAAGDPAAAAAAMEAHLGATAADLIPAD